MLHSWSNLKVNEMSEIQFVLNLTTKRAGFCSERTTNSLSMLPLKMNPTLNPQCYCQAMSTYSFSLNSISLTSTSSLLHLLSFCQSFLSFSSSSSSLSFQLIPTPLPPPLPPALLCLGPPFFLFARRSSAASVRLTDHCNSYTLISCTNH